MRRKVFGSTAADVDESDDNEQVSAKSKRRGAAQLAGLVLGLVMVVVVVVVVGVVLVAKLVLPADGCDANGYCHETILLATVETSTGYDFPEGSEVIDAVHGTNRVSGVSSMTATIAMPAGSFIPTSYDRLSSIQTLKPDGSGRVIVSVSTSDGGADGFPR